MRFVIIASARTGSSHLVNVLGGHPEIFCHGNVFASHMMAVFWPKTAAPPAKKIETFKSELRDLREKDPDAFLDRVFSMNYDYSHVGFKIFRGQNDYILEKLLADDSVRKVLLFRRNVLANYSSAMIAKDNQVWDMPKGKETRQQPQIEFNEQEFVVFHNNFMRYYRNVISALNEKRQQFHLINYDEINDPLMLAATVNFIGADGTRTVDETDIKKVHVKQNTSNILERFSNSGAVEDFLARVNRNHWKYEGETSISLITRSQLSAHDADQDTAA
jgi:LPS sulfotransferase NodH